MIRVTESIHIEIDIPRADAKRLLSDIMGKTVKPSQITMDLVQLLQSKLEAPDENKMV